MDGLEGKRYPGIGGWSLVFGPDSRWVAYAAQLWSFFKGGNGWTLVVDGQEGEPYDQIPGVIIFDSPDHLHYFAFRSARGIYLVDEHLA